MKLKIDELTTGIQTETDQARRGEMIREAFRIHGDVFDQIPLHQQALAWACAREVNLVQVPTNSMNFNWVTLNCGDVR